MRNKKNLFKTMLVLAMAMIMTLAMGITALADAAAHKIIIEPTDKANHTYKAYAIFTGDVDEDKVLTNAKWGDGVDKEKLIDELTKDSSPLKDDFSGISASSSATDVVAKIAAFSTKEAKVTAFADIVEKCLVAAKGIEGAKNAEEKYEIPVDNGYYFVKDEQASFGEDAGAYTKYMLQVVGEDVSVKSKSEVPTIDKVIVDGQDDGKASVAGIGDVVTYKISTKIPDMTGYNKYYFVINDTLEEGLTFNNDIVVKKNGASTSDYKLTSGTDTNGNTTLKIVLSDVLNKYAKDDVIEITYTATLNEKAVRTTEGNKNSVNLTYSNNPNFDYVPDSEKPDEPKSGDPVGITPTKEVKTYTTSLKLVKTDAATAKALAGAEFEITGTAWKKVLETKTEFVAAADGTYYALKNGTYTTDVPTDATADKYVSTTDKYKATEKAEVKEIPDTKKITASVDGNGELILNDIGAGKFEIKEITAPAGYNLLTETVKVEVKTTELSFDKVTWATDSSDATVNADGSIVLTIENSKGIVLPTTGGIGTTIFYVVGGILVVGAAILLVTKKRMSVEEN